MNTSLQGKTNENNGFTKEASLYDLIMFAQDQHKQGEPRSSPVNNSARGNNEITR